MKSKTPVKTSKTGAAAEILTPFKVISAINVSYRIDACTCMYTIAYMQQLKVMVSQLNQRMDSLEKQNVRILALVKSVRDQQKKTERDRFRIDDSPFKFSYSDLVHCKRKRVVLTMQALVTIVASQCLLHCGGQRMYPRPQMLCSFTS